MTGGETTDPPAPAVDNKLARLQSLITKMSVADKEVKSGSSVFSGDGTDKGALEEELRAKFRELELYFDKDGNDPDGEYVVPKLQCIAFDAQSDYALQRGIAQGNDQWWTRLQYNYKWDGKSCTSDVLPIFGCYLDLHKRTSVKLAKYGSSLVNVYVPSTVVKTLCNQLSKCGYNIAVGKEIVDHRQGLTSFLMSTVRGKDDLSVTFYRVNADDSGKEACVKKVLPMSSVYANAPPGSDASILGGVAFVHFNCGYECASGQIPKSGFPPQGSLIDMKFKIVGFHALGLSGHSISQITYSKRRKEDY